jgi:uncharacterized protein (DUF427 family)
VSLSRGTGPLSPRPAGVGNFTVDGPAHKLWWEDNPRRVRAIVGGTTVADSRRTKLLFETALGPVWYFPEEDLRTDLLERSDTVTHCPFKGDAAYWSLRVGEEVRPDLIWGYDAPLPGAPPLAGHRAFYFDRVDTWMEEDEEVGVHPRDPYHRIDVLASSRHVVLELGGQVLAESRRPLLLFETGLPTRYYLPRADVRAELLRDSGTTTGCPYKGTARYHDVVVDGTVHDDLVWCYPDPIPEAGRIAGLLCFYDERVDLIVDGERRAAS